MISYPLNIYQGDDYLANVNVTANGQPFTLTGYTAVAQIRRDVADIDTGTPDATFTCTIVQPCTVRLQLARGITAALSGCYQWDLELHDPSGNIMTIARGPCHVAQEVTR